MSDPVSFKYRAFLSYAHADLAWGKWLHGQLEAYRLDRDLVGRETALGPVPKSLRPIFRDREDFSGGHTLTDATIAALDASAALIVLCSTVAATRPAVNEEVRLFRSRHPDRPVVPVILEGHYPTNFPQALLFELAADGSLTNNPITMLAPDLRGKGDGKTLGLAKVVAGLTGLAPDDIFRRALRAQKRANLLRAAIAAVFLAVASGGGFFLWQSQQRAAVIARNEADFSAIRAIADRMLAANPAAADVPGAKDTLVATLTSIQEQVAAGDADYVKANELLKAGKGAEAVPLLIAAAEAKKRRAVGEAKASAKAYREAAAIAAVAEPGKARALYAEAALLDPDDVEGMLQYALFQLDARALADADRAFRRVLTLSKPSIDDARAIASHFGLGDAHVARGQNDQAEAEYKLGGDLAYRLSANDKSNTNWRYYIAVSYEKIGDLSLAVGNSPEALKNYQARLSVVQSLVKEDTTNLFLQRDLLTAFSKIGNVEVTRDRLPAALKSYNSGLTIARHLINIDQTNIDWARNISMLLNKIGTILVAEGSLESALKHYQESYAIAIRLASADKGNPMTQSDLSVSLNNIGSVFVKLGNLPDALKNFRSSLSIRRHLTETDSSNAEWQSELAVSFGMIGDALVSQHDTSEALLNYQQGATIYIHLTELNKNILGWQRDLSVFLQKIGNIESARGNLPEAIMHYQAGLDIARRLVVADSSNANWQKELSALYSRIGDLRVAENNTSEALRNYRASLDITQSLADTHKENVEWQRDLIIAYAKMAGRFPGQGWWFKAHEVVQRLSTEGWLAPADAWMLGDTEAKAKADGR